MSDPQDSGASPSLGQKTMANSAPVVIASDQSPIPITGAITATNASVGVNGAVDPGSSTQVGGTDGAGNLEPVRLFDGDSGGGTEFVLGTMLRASAPGGSVEAGTALNPLVVTGTISATNPSVGLNGAPIPTSSTEIGGKDDAGNLQPVHIKPAATAAVAADPALVVAISPNNSVAITSPDLDVPLSTRASEATLAALDATVVASLDVPLSTRASQATLAALNATVAASLDTTLSSRATAAQQTDGTQRTKITDGVTNAAVKAAATAAVAADPALVVAVSPNNTVAVTPPTLAKGTQGATGFSVQDLHDAGRVSKVFQNTSITGSAAEQLISLVMLSGLVAVAAATSYTVTAGKTLRITGLLVTWTNATAALGSVTIRVRAAAVAPAIISSPVIATVAAFSSAATVGSNGSQYFPFLEGFELPAGSGVALTQLARTAVAGFDVQLIGYEY